MTADPNNQTDDVQTDEPFLTVELAIGTVPFQEPKDFNAWFELEQKFQSEYLNDINGVEGYEDVHSLIKTRFQKIQDSWSKVSEGSTPGLLAILKTTIEEGYRDEIIHSTSPEARMIKDCRIQSTEANANHLSAFLVGLHQGKALADREHDYSLFLSRVFASGIPTGMEDRLFSTHENEWVKKLDNFSSDFRKLNNEVSELIAKQERQIQTRQQIHDLKEPASYWESKRIEHRNAARNIAKAFLAAAVLGGGRNYLLECDCSRYN